MKFVDDVPALPAAPAPPTAAEAAACSAERPCMFKEKVEPSAGLAEAFERRDRSSACARLLPPYLELMLVGVESSLLMRAGELVRVCCGKELDE